MTKFHNLCSFVLLAMAMFFLFSQKANAQNSVSDYGCVDVPEFDVGCEADYFVAETVNGNEIDTYAEAETDYEDVTVRVRGDIYINGVLANSQFGANGEESEAYPSVSLTSVPGSYTGVVDATACAIAILDPGSDCGDGGTSVTIFATLPNISSINPPTIMVGSSGTITVTGANFLDQFGNQPLPVSNAGVSLAIASISNGEAVLSYSVPATAIAGQSSVFFEGLFGDGAGQTLTIIDPSPTITGINPPAWPSGTTTSVTITGRGFGTSPSVTIAGPGVTGTSITYVSDTQIIANVAVAPLVAAQTATVQVQSNGYTGSGFLGSPGQPQRYAVSIPLSPVQVVPQILFFGNAVIGTIPITVGQEVSLRVQPPPGLLTAVSGSFFSSKFGPFNIPGAIDGWAATSGPTSSPTYTNNTSSIPSSVSASPPFTFYWITQGTFTVTYTWMLQDVALGESAGSSSVIFNVIGPNNPAVTVNAGIVSVLPVTKVDGNGIATGDAGSPTIILNGAKYGEFQYGIILTPSIDADGTIGSFSWVQLIQQYTVRYLLAPAVTQTCQLVQMATGANGQPLASLDNAYPYVAVNQPSGVAVDDPGLKVAPTSEISIVFLATSYLLWTPKASSDCTDTPNNCTVPIPQGYVAWNTKGDAINTQASQANGTTWVAESALCVNNSSSQGGNFPPAFVISSAYPAWGPTFYNDAPVTNCTAP